MNTLQFPCYKTQRNIFWEINIFLKVYWHLFNIRVNEGEKGDVHQRMWKQILAQALGEKKNNPKTKPI